MTASNQFTTRAFGRTGYAVAPVCLGTGSWGRRKPGESLADADERVADMARPLALGELATNFLDTSNEYGDARSELLIGSALAASAARLAEAGADDGGLVIQTKLDRDVSTGEFTGDRMWRSLEESLSRLGVDHLQVLYLHDPEHIGFEAAMADDGPVAALVAMKEQGIVSATGISGGPVGLLQQFVETDVFDALISHNRYTLVDRSASALFDAATERGLGITNGAPYGAGILTGDPRFAETYGYLPATAQVKEAVAGLTRLCRDFDVSLSAAALQFSIREPRIHSTVVGVSSRRRLETALSDAVADLPAELWAELEAVVPAGIALDD